MNQPSRPLLSASFVALFFSLLSSCSSQTIWNRPISTVRENLIESRYDGLASLDFSRDNPAEAFKLGQEAPYYLYFIMSDLGKEAEAVTLLELLVERGSTFWRTEALALLLRHLVDKKRFERAEALATDNLKLLQSSAARHETRHQIKKLFLESLYWQRKDQEVLAHMSALFEAGTIDEDPELILFRAITSFRTGSPDWETHFERLFAEHTASSFHIRAYRFLTQDPDRITRFSENTQALLEGKHELAVGRYGQAVGLLEKAVSNLSAASLSGTTLVKELGFAHLHAGSFIRGASYLEGISSKLAFRERLDAIEMSGRNLRKALLREKGIANLRRVASETRDSLQRDRCLWFILDMSLKSSQGKGLTEIESSASRWNDVSYFDDILDRLLTELTLKGDDKTLLRLYRVGRKFVSSYILFRLTFILTVKGYVVEVPTDTEFRKLDESLNATMGTLYYAYLLSAMGKGGPVDLITRDKHTGAGDKSREKGDDRNAAGERERQPKSNTVDGLVLGFINFGLYERGYRGALKNLRSLALETLRTAASKLAEMNHLADGMRLMNIYLTRKDSPPTKEEWRLAFPMPYHSQLETLAEGVEIPLYLLYAVVREESYFDPQTGSRAGAVGLMQLMPETAKEMAGELKLRQYDLKNPEDNLKLGVRYLAKLLRKTGSWTGALMSYNAGPTKVRRWARRYTNLESEIFVEIVPFAETRHYVRKVLVSTVLYSLIYNDAADLKEVIGLFYAHLLNQIKG